MTALEIEWFASVLAQNLSTQEGTAKGPEEGPNMQISKFSLSVFSATLASALIFVGGPQALACEEKAVAKKASPASVAPKKAQSPIKKKGPFVGPTSVRIIDTGVRPGSDPNSVPAPEIVEFERSDSSVREKVSTKRYQISPPTELSDEELENFETPEIQ